jgi:hypothetical protein
MLEKKYIAVYFIAGTIAIGIAILSDAIPPEPCQRVILLDMMGRAAPCPTTK